MAVCSGASAAATGEGTSLDKAIAFLQRSGALERDGRLDEAVAAARTGVDYLRISVKYCKGTASMKQTIQEKLTEQETRLAILTQQQSKHSTAEAAVHPAGATATAVKPGGGDATKETSKMREQLMDAVVAEKPHVQWSDIAGLDVAKEALIEAVVFPLKLRHLFEQKRLEPWRGILLFGPPGTGKTQLARAVATETNATMFAVKSSDLITKWMGESEKLVAELFQMAKEHKPSIIFIDEVDALCSKRTENEHDAMRRIKTELLQQMDGITSSLESVLVLAATNLPWQLDTAFCRRFQRRIYIPLPDVEALAEMIKIHLVGIPHSLTEQDTHEIALKIPGYSGSDVRALVQDARYEGARLLSSATHFVQIVTNQADALYMPCSPGTTGAFECSFRLLGDRNLLDKVALAPVAVGDFYKALLRTKPTVSQNEVFQYESYTAQFGQEGSQ
eukprot:TRINITY_DN5268_c0_g1_i1.p1 TRINITY_DN5268_c0_g1~~TRINITY_DN5268_c0_g1_i1.p1  ORF type:complete len:457 (+),score=138.23 TRINITY_DN5268_c0_g1_i1:29-1372(+)